MDDLLEVETCSDSVDQLQHSDKEVRKGEHLLIRLCEGRGDAAWRENSR